MPPRGGVRRLDVLKPGLAASSDCDDGQPLRFLVELADATRREYADRWFSLKEGLEQLLQCPVLLLTPHALGNPYRRAEVEGLRQVVYFRGSEPASTVVDMLAMREGCNPSCAAKT